MTDQPEFTAARCARLREAFQRIGFDPVGVAAVLDGPAQAALGRGEPEPAYRATRDAGELGTALRLFLLGDAVPEDEVRRALAPLPLDDACAAGLITRDGGEARAALDVRPHGEKERSWWVICDLDPGRLRGLGRAPADDHVHAVGHASLSLARATPRRPVGTLLDLGTGNGIQALYGSTHAAAVTATDVSPRALALATGTFLLNQADVELLGGSWFTPVARRRFDQVVCNPPFVVGPPRVDYTYRDAGLGGDDASALVVRQLPGMLTAGGTGHLLASWLHRRGEDWTDRVARWVPQGTDAWFVQRDVADPALYVGTWLRDAGIDPGSPEGRSRAAAWLDWFAANEVDGVGFGFVTLSRLDTGAPVVRCEDLTQPFDDPLGPEAAAWLDRVAWLRGHPDLLAERFVVPDTVVLEQVSAVGDEGWQPAIHRVHRTDGPRWQHDVDEAAVALLAGSRGALPLADLLGLLAAAHDVPFDRLAPAAVPMVRDLLLHGFLLPAEGDR